MGVDVDVGVECKERGGLYLSLELITDLSKLFHGYQHLGSVLHRQFNQNSVKASQPRPAMHMPPVQHVDYGHQSPADGC